MAGLVSTIEIDGDKYNLTQASAVNQKSLMTIVGAKIMMNSMGAQSGVVINSDLIKGSLLTTPEDQLDRIAEIVLHQCIKQGSDQLITIESFQGSMNAYFELLAKAIEVNLSDFFTWCDTVKRGVATQDQTQPVKK